MKRYTIPIVIYALMANLTIIPFILYLLFNINVWKWIIYVGIGIPYLAISILSIFRYRKSEILKTHVNNLTQQLNTSKVIDQLEINNKRLEAASAELTKSSYIDEVVTQSSNILKAFSLFLGMMYFVTNDLITTTTFNSHVYKATCSSKAIIDSLTFALENMKEQNTAEIDTFYVVDSNWIEPTSRLGPKSY